MSPKNAKNVLSNRNHKKEMPKLLNYRTGPFFEICNHFQRNEMEKIIYRAGLFQPLFRRY